MITRFDIEQQATRVWQDAYKTVLASAAPSATDPDRLTSMARAAAEGAERDYRARCERLRGEELKPDLRELCLGFREAVGPRATANIISRPQVVFYAERLVIPSDAEKFSILDFKVGNRSQLVESIRMPATAFAETAIGIRLAWEPAFVAQDVVISVENETDAAEMFRAVLFGTGLSHRDLFDRLGLPLSLREADKDAA